MKVQPVDDAIRFEPAKPPLAPAKSRLKRLLERFSGDAADQPEPSTICLDKMVINFIEESPAERPPTSRCGRGCRNCFHGHHEESSDDDEDDHSTAAEDLVKGLAICATVEERNLLADVCAAVERHKDIKGGSKRKDDLRRLVAEALRASGHDAAVCRSQWDKSPSFPAGKHEYVDVVAPSGVRLLVDLEFRSEFEIARSTKRYCAVLQALPAVFVGSDERLRRLVTAASEAARLSLKKRGLSFPPWRKADYMVAKWLSPYERILGPQQAPVESEEAASEQAAGAPARAKEEAAVVVRGFAALLREKA